MSEQNESGAGSMVGIIIVVLILIIGGVYFFNQRVEKQDQLDSETASVDYDNLQNEASSMSFDDLEEGVDQLQ